MNLDKMLQEKNLSFLRVYKGLFHKNQLRRFKQKGIIAVIQMTFKLLKFKLKKNYKLSL
jgi:hypothetical protein